MWYWLGLRTPRERDNWLGVRLASANWRWLPDETRWLLNGWSGSTSRGRLFAGCTIRIWGGGGALAGGGSPIRCRRGRGRFGRWRDGRGDRRRLNDGAHGCGQEAFQWGLEVDCG